MLCVGAYTGDTTLVAPHAQAIGSVCAQVWRAIQTAKDAEAGSGSEVEAALAEVTSIADTPCTGVDFCCLPSLAAVTREVEAASAVCAEYYELSLEQGDAAAHHMLGLCHHKGNRRPQDFDEAVRLFELSAQRGNTDARHMLALSKLNGEGAVKDVDKGVQALYDCAALGTCPPPLPPPPPPLPPPGDPLRATRVGGCPAARAPASNTADNCLSQ